MNGELSFDQWRNASDRERNRIAKQIEASNDGRFRWIDLHRYELGGAYNDVARFEYGEVRFVFVPGQTVNLGFDPRKQLKMSPAQLESWQGTADEYGIKEPLEEFLEAYLTRRRVSQIPPMLVQTVKTEVGIEPVTSNHPLVEEAVERLRSSPGTHSIEYHKALRVIRADDNQIQAFRIGPVTHADVMAQLEQVGFRLPTSDEWEFLCGAGTSTLFRWGNDCPNDRYPTDLSREEAAWRRQWVLSGGKLEPSVKPFKRDWCLHVQPNALGFEIASNPYDSEIVAEPGIFRGSDGGGNICGGAGFFMGWLPLATAYVDPYIKDYYEDSVSETFLRRIWPLE